MNSCSKLFVTFILAGFHWSSALDQFVCEESCGRLTEGTLQLMMSTSEMTVKFSVEPGDLCHETAFVSRLVIHAAVRVETVILH